MTSEILPAGRPDRRAHEIVLLNSAFEGTVRLKAQVILPPLPERFT